MSPNPAPGHGPSGCRLPGAGPTATAARRSSTGRAAGRPRSIGGGRCHQEESGPRKPRSQRRKRDRRAGAVAGVPAGVANRSAGDGGAAARS
jgi:hypothetical protein